MLDSEQMKLDNKQKRLGSAQERLDSEQMKLDNKQERLQSASRRCWTASK